MNLANLVRIMKRLSSYLGRTENATIPVPMTLSP